MDASLRGAPGVATLAGDPGLLSEVTHLARLLDADVAADRDRPRLVEADAGLLAGTDLEAINAALVGLKDAVWAIEHDRVRTAREVRLLAGPQASANARRSYLSIQQALSALDRLEVRGRDSAGLHVLVRGHQLDLRTGAVAAELAAPDRRPAVRARGSVAVADGHLGFVYKAAAEIGELGDNTRALRAALGGRRPAAPGPAGADGRGGGAGPHPLGQRRDHLAGQRPPPQLRRAAGHPARRSTGGRPAACRT